MSVYRRMLGRELPCSVTDLLELPAQGMDPRADARLVARAEAGQASFEELCPLVLGQVRRGEAGRAIRALRLTLAIRPAEVASRVLLAIAYEAIAQHDRAAAQLDAILAEPVAGIGNISRVMLLCAAGLSHEKAGHWQCASRRYNDALKTAPTELFARHRLVAISLAHGRLAQAALHLRAILRHDPAEKAARVCLAHLLQMAGRHQEAAWQYEQALCLEPDSWELPVDLSAELHQAEGSDQVINVLQQLVEVQPHFPDLRLRLGNLYSQQGDDEAASIEYEQALALHPEYLECHIAFARHELRMGRLDQAAHHFRAAVEINDQNVEVYVGLSLALNQSGRTSRAMEVLDSAKRIASNSAVLVAQLAMVERQALADEADPACGVEMRVEWLRELVERDEAVLAEHPLWNDVRVRQGMLLRLLGESDRAWSVLRGATRNDPDCGPAWIQLGMALADCGKPEQAEGAFAAAIRLDHDRAQLHYRLGLIHCGELELDLTMERIEEVAENPVDVNRRVWTAIDSMHMSGPCRRREASVSASR